MTRRQLAAVFVAVSFFFSAGSTGGAVVDADGDSLTPLGHPGAIFDSSTDLLWLDATETQNRSLADVQSELGTGGEFEGWQVATRSQIHQLFTNANLAITVPGPGWVQDSISQTRVQALASIYGQTRTASTVLGTFLWHANSLDDQANYGSEAAAWRTTDNGYWAGDNGVAGWAGTANPEFGVALVRPVSGVFGNLILNPGFDSDLNGWGNTGSTTSWSSEDAGGSGSSGSARLDLSVNMLTGIRSTCVTAAPGDVFFFSTGYLIPPGQQATGTAPIQIRWFDQAGCHGVSTGTYSEVGTQTAWTTIGNRLVAPTGTASTYVVLYANRTGGTGDFTVHFDDVELVSVPESSGSWAVVIATLVALRCWRRRAGPRC